MESRKPLTVTSNQGLSFFCFGNKKSRYPETAAAEKKEMLKNKNDFVA